MATGADIPVSISETREQVGIFVDNIINISVSKLSLEKHTRDDQFNEHPTVEGENFLRPPSAGEVHHEVNTVSPDVSKVTEEPDQAVKDGTDALLPSSKLEDQPVEAAANEEISTVEIQQNGEESNSTEKDGDNTTDSSVVTSEIEVGDKLEDGDARVVTQLSNDTGSSLTEHFETSNHDELQSKSDLNSSFTKEEETTAKNGDEISTTSEDSRVPLENTLSESHGDEDDATDHSIPSLAEKSKETSLVQVKDSQIERDEHLEEESERLPSTEVSTGDTNDSIPPATHNVKDKDEDIIEAELSENEPSTRCLSVEEDRQIEVSNLSQKNSIQGNTIEAEEATIDAVDRQKKSLENLSVGEAHAERNNVAPDLSEVNEEPDQTVRDGTDTLLLVPKLDDQKLEFAANEEISVEEIQPNAEESNSTEKDGDGGAVPEQCSTDSSVVTSEVKAGDTFDDPDVDDARVVTQLSKDTSIDQHGTNDSSTENIALTKEILEETNIPNEETESLTCIKEGEELIVQVKTTDNKSEAEKTAEEDVLCDLTSEVSKEGESDQNKTTSEHEVLANERSVEDNSNTATGEASQDDSASKETTTALELQSKCESNSSLSKEEETTVEKGDRSLTGEKSEESSLVQIEDSKVDCEEQLEQEGERLPLTEVSTGATNDNVPPVTDIASKETTTTLELQSKSKSNSSLSKEEETTVEKGDRFLTAEKSEESSLVQIEDSKIDCDEQLEVEGERPPLTEVSTGATNDSVPLVTDIASKETTTTPELQSKSESNSSLLTEEETTVEKGGRSLTAEKSEESSLAQIEDSKIECDEHLEEEGERLPLTEVSTGATNDVPPVTDIVEDKDEDIKEVELSENEPATSTSVKEDKHIETHAESLPVAPEDIEESNLSQENSIKDPPQEQSTDATLHGNINEVEEATIDAVDQQKECLESFPSIVSSSLDEGSLNAVLQEVTSDQTDEKTIDKVDKHAEVLENLTIGEAHSEINNFAPDIREVTEKPDQTVRDSTDTLLLSPKLDDQPVESAADEEISVEEIQQNAEELNSTEKDGDRGVVPEQCSTDSLVGTSEVKAGETLDDLNVDDARVATQLSKDTSSDEQGTNDTFTKNISLAKEILEETNIPNEETESQAPCIAEGEELNVQVKTTDNKSEDEKTTKEDTSCNLTSEVSKEGESDQNKTTSEQEVFASDRSVEDYSNTAGEEVGQENSASTESITTIETSDSNKLQSNSNFISSFSKEDETVERGDRSVTTSEDYGVPLENSLSESHGDIEWQSKALEDAATDHSYSKLAEKSEESSLDNDNVSEAIDKIEDEGKELKEAELFENEQSIGCTLVKEDVQIEHPAESLHVAAEGIEVSDSHQENNIKGPLEEQSTNADLHGNTIEADEATINDVVDPQKESLESISTTISTEDAEGNSFIKLDGSENQNEDDIGKEEEKVPLAREISDEPKLLHEAQFDDGESKKAEFCSIERSTESILLNTESITSNTEDSLHVTSEDNKAPDLSQEIETRTAIEEPDLSTHPQGILEKRSDSEIVDEAETKEDPLENISNENSGKDLLIEEHPNDDESTILLEPKTANECLSTVELPNNEKSTDCTIPNKENLQDAPEDHKTSTSSEATETTLSLEEQSLTENSQVIIGNTIIEAADQKELALENAATEIPYEHIEENSVTQVYCSEREHEELVEKDNQNASLAEATIEETNARDWESRKIEEADEEKPVDSLQVNPEDIKQHDSKLDINNSIEEQIQDTDPREISSDNKEREPVDAVDTNEEILKAKGIAENNLDCDKDAASDEVSTKNTEGSLIKEEEFIELETNIEPPKGIEPPLLGQDRETSCLDEQSPTANTEGVMDDTKEDIADNANGAPKDKENIANTTLHEEKEENSQVQEDCLRLEKNEDLGNDSESTPFTEAPRVYTTESSPVKEEQVENSVEEEIITANPQEICNKTQEKIVDAANEKDEVVVNVPNGDNEDNSPIEVDGSQKPSSEEAPAEKIIDDEPTDVHEASSANEKTVKANLFEEEEKIENALAKEEAATSSVQDREASYLVEQAPTTNSQGTSVDHKEGKMIQLADEKEEIVEDKNYATTPYEDTIEDSLIQVDGSLLEQKEHSEMDNESTSLTDAPKDTITESISVREVAQDEDPIESSKVATEDIKAFASCQDTEISSTEKQILDAEDISSNNIAEKTIEETSKETQEAQDIAKSVPHEEVSSNVEDGSQKAYVVEGSVGIIDEHESTTSQDEQILSADPRELIDDNKDNKTIDPIDFQKETPTDEEPKEIESVDDKATSIELKDEEAYLKDIQMTTAVNLVAAHQEKSSNLTAEQTPSAEDLDVNEDIIEQIPEVRNDKQQEPSITEVSEEHVATSNEHVSENTSLEPEVSESNNDQVVGEANSCGDKTDSEKIEVPNDGYIAVPTDEILAETDPRGSTEAEVQVPNGEKDTELSIQEAEIDQKHVKETLLHNASEYVSESEEVNGGEKTDSNNCNEISGSNNSVASQEVSTSNVAIEEDSACNSSQQPRKETREETETKEPQKQDSELQVSELIQDSTVENIERDAQPFLASANDSGITEEVQKLQEVPLPAPEENITTDCKESNVVEGATNEDIDHPEQNDTTKSFSDNKKPIEEALEETIANDILPVPLSEISKVDHSTTERELTNREEPSTENTATGDDEKEASQEKISDISSDPQARDTYVAKSTDNSDNVTDTTEVPMINENTSVECILVNERSVTDLETKIDDEAPEIKETTPSSAEGQNVEEKSNTPGSLTEEKSDSDEVAPGENKSGYESNNQMLESIAHVQSRDIISETEERKTEEDNLKAEAEIKSAKAVADDTLEQEETTCEKEILKDDIPSEKEKLLRGKAEDEDIKDYDQGSCGEEVVRDSHQEDEIKQEQQKISKETVEFLKDGSHTEMVSKVFEEAEDKAPEDREEKILTNEAIDKIFHQEEQEKSIEEPTTKIDTVKAHELAIASVNTDTGDSNKEGVQIAINPGEESEEQNNKDEICSSGKILAKDEENIMLSEGKSKEEAKQIDTWTKPNEDEEKEAYVEVKKLDFASQTEGISECTVIDDAHIPEDSENSTIKNNFSEEDYPSKSTVVEVSSATEDVALTEQASEATIDTAEVQEAKAGIDLGVAAPKATEIESQEVEEVNDKCAVMEDTSTPVEPPVISTSKIIPEWTVGTPLEAEDQQTELHDLQEELNIEDSEVQMAEKDDVVNLQSARDISKDVQELSKESFEVSNNENPVEEDPEEKIETNEGQETKPVQNASGSETLEEETEEQQLGRGTEDVHEEQEKINSIPNQLESTYGTEPSIPQSSLEDKAQHEKREGSQQIDSPPSLPQAQCSDIKTSEKDLLVHVAGLDSVDVAELEASPLPLKDKHIVLEADDAKILNHENQGGNKNISTEFSQGEHETEKPSKVEQEEAECGNEKRKDQEREGKPEPEETGKPSLSELFQVSMRGTSQMADHSAIEKEPTGSKDPRAENSDEAEHENSKTDEEKDDEEESHEQQISDSVSEAPVMVDMVDADVKVAHKKSHNILSGVGSKVKHSIAKVKKAITGKSSHPKPPSPKKVTN